MDQQIETVTVSSNGVFDSEASKEALETVLQTIKSEGQRRAVNRIKHDMSLAKQLAMVYDKLQEEAKTRTLKRYIYKVDPAINDRLFLLAKGRLKQMGITYQQLGEFYKEKTGKEYLNLSKNFLASFYIERRRFD